MTDSTTYVNTKYYIIPAPFVNALFAADISDCTVLTDVAARSVTEDKSLVPGDGFLLRL